MGELLSHVSAAVVFAIAIVPGVMLAAILAWNALRRGERRRRREESRDLAASMIECAIERLPAAELRACAGEATESGFWEALENCTGYLDRPARVRLSRAIGGTRRVRSERRRLGEDSPWRRELAARRLGLLSEPRTRRALRVCLERGPEMVTFAAALGLARDRDARTLRWILAHPEALAHRHRNAWIALLKAFGKGALPVLAAELEHGIADPRLERAILEVLGLGRWSPAAPAIAGRLRHPDVDVRVGAARALGAIGALDCTPALLAVLDDKEWPVRAHAARALGRIGAPAALEPLLFRLTDPSWWVRRHAAYALYQLGPAGREALRDIAEESPDRYARDMADEALEHGNRFTA